jgi:transcriptional regulator with XRE-family HTH domain
LAGLSADYVLRLEQGRAKNPSAQVVGALARALQLSRAERDQLYRSAGLLPPRDGTPAAVSPSSIRTPRRECPDRTTTPESSAPRPGRAGEHRHREAHRRWLEPLPGDIAAALDQPVLMRLSGIEDELVAVR